MKFFFIIKIIKIKAKFEFFLLTVRTPAQNFS